MCRRRRNVKSAFSRTKSIVSERIIVIVLSFRRSREKMAKIEGGVSAQRTFHQRNGANFGNPREAEFISSLSAEAAAQPGEERAEGAAHPVPEPHCQTGKKDSGLREEGTVPVRQDQEV
jgi:hypothetical protein